MNRILTKSTFYGLLLTASSLCLSALGLEVLLRIYHGALFHFGSVHTAIRPGAPTIYYHPRLGWIPRAGRFSRLSGGWSWSIDESGLRSNGRPVPTTGGPILTVGDSFTFGDEVEDSETWPAQLEKVLHRRVLNAGVFAYGIDQACLRAEDLLEVYEPTIVILAFISSDVSRTELSYYHRTWKPYFEYVNGGLELRNVPVPQGHAWSRRLPALNRTLGYSYLANAVLRRTPLGQWYLGPDRLKSHDDGERVTVGLLTRLDRLVQLRGGRFVALALATNGQIGGNERLPTVIERLREDGVQVLDLASVMLQMREDRFMNMFKSGGHYSHEMNGWVAEQVAAFLQGKSGASAKHSRSDLIATEHGG